MILSKYADFYSVIFYSEAAYLSIYYNIAVLNESYTNTIDYEYPTPTSYMEVSYSDPLR
jgi:hypothetical protein